MISFKTAIIHTPDGVTVYGHPWPRDTAIEAHEAQFLRNQYPSHPWITL